jgi:hypothetical protein
MKNIPLLIACLLIHVSLYGCIKKAVDMHCSPPLAKFNTIYIMNFDTESTIDEFGAGSSTLKGITNTIIDELEKNLIEGRKFSKIIRGSRECADEALRVEGKLVQIKYNVKGSSHKITNDLSITKVKGKYEIITNTRIVKCKTGETIFLFETNDRDSDLFDLSKELGEDIATYINKKAGQCD